MLRDAQWGGSGFVSVFFIRTGVGFTHLSTGNSYPETGQGSLHWVTVTAVLRDQESKGVLNPFPPNRLSLCVFILQKALMSLLYHPESLLPPRLSLCLTITLSPHHSSCHMFNFSRSSIPALPGAAQTQTASCLACSNPLLAAPTPPELPVQSHPHGCCCCSTASHS